LTADNALRSVAGPVIDLSKLNPPQREAVTHGSGPLLVLAGAGSGKTRVITYRIVRLLHLGISPTALCAVTFTNKAATEMRQRAGHLLGDAAAASKLTMGTFHSLGLSILRHERKALGMPGGFAIYDQADQLGAVRQAMRSVREIGSSGERRYDAKAIATRISLAKNALVAPEDYKPRISDEYDAIAELIYPRYQDVLRSCGAFDFDDLITAPVRLFDTHPEIRERWAARFRHVMVDEFQDTNHGQLLMIKHLVAEHGNLCVVGDDDQSIYSWRGADPTNILRFAQLFAGAHIVKLEQNYRSSRNILDAANAVIAHNKARHGKTLWSDRGQGDNLIHAVADSPEKEAQWVAREIVSLRADGRAWSDVAVLYRSNVQAKMIEEELRQAGVPYVMYGGQQFFERKEVKDLIAYLRVALNPRDDLSLRRVLNYPARGIGASTVERMVALAATQHASLWKVLRQVAGGSPLPAEEPELDLPDARVAALDSDPAELRPATRNGIADFVAVVSRLAAAVESGVDVVKATRTLMDDIGLYDDLRQAAGSMAAAQRRIDNVEGFLGTLARRQEAGGGRQGLGEYLRRLSLESEEESEKVGDRVVMTTLHGAKGLEFPVCFMIGMEEELIPHIRTLQPQASDVVDGEHATDISEERRLCYVGITRAQHRLYLTRALTRVSRGKQLPRTPSRFLLEIPDELLDVRDLVEEAHQAVPATEIKSFFSSFSFDE
jgi:DNA helicase-2/ATP-dependent DNA helicase PcrA